MINPHTMDIQPTKREAILNAALELLVEYDIQNTAMSKIAKRANTGMGTIYNYFESKEVLLFELYHTLQQRLHAAVFAAYPTNGSYQERFSHVWRTLCRYYINHPNEFLFGERYEASAYFTEEVNLKTTNLFAELIIMFEEAKTNHVIKDIRLEYFLPMARGAFSAILRNHITGRVSLDQEAIEQTINNFWGSISASTQ